MATSTDKFEELEERIIRTIELVKATRLEKANAEKALAASRSEIKALEQELEQLRRERDLVKNKVESLLDSLAELTEGSVV